MALFQSAVFKNYIEGVCNSLNKVAEWLNSRYEQKAQTEELKPHIFQADKEIDAMVYELYGLSEEEVRVVEGGV